MQAIFGRGVIAGALALGVSLLLPLAGLAAAEHRVALKAGEAFVIKGIDADSTPEVQFADNPNAFSVQSRSASELLVLGVQSGKGTIKVKSGGKSATYEVSVQALANPAKPLEPAEAVPAAIEGKPSESAPAALDPGAGPAPSGKAAAGGSALAEKPVTGVSASAPSAAGSSAAASSSTDKAAAASPPPSAPAAATALASADGGGAKAAAPGPIIPHQGPLPEAGVKFHNNPPAAAAADSLEREPAVGGKHYLPGDAISMMTGTSRVYDFVAPIRRVSIADSKVADIQVINPHQLMLVGHEPGFTTLVVWDAQARYEERQVRIEKEGHQQVVLNVVVAELNRSRIEREGIDYSVAFTKLGFSLAGLPGNVATNYSPQSNLQTSGAGGTSSGGIPPPGGNPFPLLLSSNITYALTAQNSNLVTDTFFQFLEDHSLARILAQPRLLANSGEEAKFLSGGEIPIVIAQALNTSIVFKQFGTSVKFLPTVVGRHDIELVVKPEVSKPDFAQGVQLFGFTVPAFVTRRAETAVRMKDNQTLIIAGLMLDDNTSKVRKVPYLGDIPFAGALFRSTDYEHVKTELVMSVTPQIVQPIPAGGEALLPTARPPLSAEEIRTRPLGEPNVARPRLY